MFILPTEPSTSQDLLAPLLLVVGILGIGLLLTISVRGKIAKRNSTRPSPREWMEHIKAVRQRPEDVHAWSGQLQETAQRLAGQLDNKAQRLESLIQQADERIATLSRSETPTSAVHPEPVSADPENGQSRTLDPLTRGVYELADAGRTSIEIAQELDEQVGKVELILALRKG